MTSRLRTQEGFTLIELLVVILVIGILASIALPAFLAQRAKAQDGASKSDVRTVVTAMESCFTEGDRYDGCPDDDPGVEWGTGPGQIEVTSAGETYLVVAHSHTGNTFNFEKFDDSTTARTCSAAGDPRGGCVDGQW